MNQIKSKYGIVIALLLIVGGMATCQFAGNEPEEKPALVDTALFHAWKTEKQKLIFTHENTLRQLAVKQDSLYAEISEKKILLSKVRSNATIAEQKVYELLMRVDTGFVATDSITPLIVSFSEACNQSDSLCGEAIRVLEAQVDIKDSSLFYQSQEIAILKQITGQQEDQISRLNQSLETERKAGRKLVRRNRWLSAGACLLAGISTSLFVTRNLR